MKLKSKLRFAGLTLSAIAQGSCYAGFMPVGLPVVCTHLTHEKLFCTIDLEEAIQWYCQEKNLEIARENAPPLKDPMLAHAPAAETQNAMFLFACQEVMKFVAGQTFESDDGTSAPCGMVTLKGTKLLPGDVLYLPPCQVVVEKAIQGVNMAIRATPIFAHPRAYELYKLYRTVHSGPLGFFFARLFTRLVVLRSLCFQSPHASQGISTRKSCPKSCASWFSPRRCRLQRQWARRVPSRSCYQALSLPNCRRTEP